MSALPEPFVDAEVDLQDFPFMPLHVARLRDSDLAAEETPEACWYAVLLWAASWHQIPAASLPDNDTVLMRMVGLGRDARTWRKHRDAALRGFVLCNDGRLYHEVVAEQANEAWQGKIRQRHRTFCAAVRKHNERNPKNKLESPTFEQWIDLGRPKEVTNIVSSMSRVTEGKVTRETPSKRKGQGQGQGQGDLLEEEAEASCASDDALKPEHIVEKWNEIAPRLGKPVVRSLTPERRQLLKARIGQYTLDDFVAVFGKIDGSAFLRGDGGWRGCTFDWVFKKANFQKILEGNYDG